MKVTNLMLMSLDGEIASHLRENSAERIKSGFTCPEDQALLQTEIQNTEAVVIGAESIRSEGSLPLLKNPTKKGGSYPLWCVLSNKGLDKELPFWSQQDIPRVLVSQKPQKLLIDSVELWTYNACHPAKFILDELKKRGISKVLLLGGGKVNQLFYEQNLVDELKLTLAPWIVGKGVSRFVNPTLQEVRKFELISTQAVRSHLFLHYRKFG